MLGFFGFRGDCAGRVRAKMGYRVAAGIVRGYGLHVPAGAEPGRYEASIGVVHAWDVLRSRLPATILWTGVGPVKSLILL